MSARIPLPVNTLLQQIDECRWLIGENLVVSLESSPTKGPSWGDGKGSFYNLTVTSGAIPSTRGGMDSGEVRKVYDAGGASAVWELGDAFCKVKRLIPGVTREHVTLEYLRNTQGQLSFDIPKVYYHTEHDGIYYIFISKLPGFTLNEAWKSLDDVVRNRIVSRVVDICTELGREKGDRISGVDGKYLSDQYLLPRDGIQDFSPENLYHNSKDLGMDCSSFMFYHCDLGPGNILVDAEGVLTGIIDWETAGFVPKEWLRTKFRVSGGLDLPVDDAFPRTDWRKRVQLELGRQGYPDIAERWIVWWTSNGLGLGL